MSYKGVVIPGGEGQTETSRTRNQKSDRKSERTPLAGVLPDAWPLQAVYSQGLQDRKSSHGWERRILCGLTSSIESDMMRVLLAVQQDSLCSALRFVLEQESGMELVGTVTDALSLYAACQEVMPDVLLVDWDLPGLQKEHRNQRGERSLSRIHAAAPGMQVIVLGGRPEARAAAMAAGAHRFVSKADPPERLITALRSVHRDFTQGGPTPGPDNASP